MENPELEQTILEWANDNGYLVRGRRWKEELIAEKQVHYELGGRPDRFLLNRTGGEPERAIELDLQPEWIVSFVRDIWTPTGLLEYECCFGGAGFPETEGGLQGFLQSGQKPADGFFVYHGEVIPNWGSEQIPRIDRIGNYVICVGFNPSSECDGDVLDGRAFDVCFSHEALKQRTDPVSQMASQMRLLDVSTYENVADNLLCVRQEMDFVSLPNNINSYRKILDFISTAINNTE